MIAMPFSTTVYAMAWGRAKSNLLRQNGLFLRYAKAWIDVEAVT
jgi:hypothetical protein